MQPKIFRSRSCESQFQKSFTKSCIPVKNAESFGNVRNQLCAIKFYYFCELRIRKLEIPFRGAGWSFDDSVQERLVSKALNWNCLELADPVLKISERSVGAGDSLMKSLYWPVQNTKSRQFEFGEQNTPLVMGVRTLDSVLSSREGERNELATH